jgi:pfkB family carbohydrate kinase
MQPALDVVTYGEAMTLFVAAQTGDLAKVSHFTKRVAGADLNVAIGLSRLGFNVGWMATIRSAAMCSTCWKPKVSMRLASPSTNAFPPASS